MNTHHSYSNYNHLAKPVPGKSYYRISGYVWLTVHIYIVEKMNVSVSDLSFTNMHVGVCMLVRMLYVLVCISVCIKLFYLYISKHQSVDHEQSLHKRLKYAFLWMQYIYILRYNFRILLRYASIQLHWYDSTILQFYHVDELMSCRCFRIEQCNIHITGQYNIHQFSIQAYIIYLPFWSY